VLRNPIESYGELDREKRREHAEWLLRSVDRAQTASQQTLSRRRSRVVVEDLAANLLHLSALLAKSHGTPDLGNKRDPVDELVYIILSRRTREIAYQPAYVALKRRYATWEDLAAAPIDEIEEVVRSSGLALRKSHSLKRALEALVREFGACTLEPTRAWSDEETLEFLCTLPEIGPKSAACVMMCSLDRPAFPVDAHVGRVLERLGVFRVIGVDLTGTNHKVKQRLLWDVVPPALRYALHVNLLVHGRTVCLSRKPRCGSCVIATSCASRHRYPLV
jgi:DNA (cytosine-5)-methyltransferase 1